jgi:hypothetical protein
MRAAMQAFIYLSAAVTVVGFLYSWRSPRRMLYLIFYFSLIEGAYINYFYPNQLVHVLKDILIAYAYVLVIARGLVAKALHRLGPLLLPIAIFFAIYILHLFNPELGDWVVGLVGLRVAIFYIPLVMVALVAFEDEEQIWRFVRYCLLLAVPVCLYGIYQYFGGSAHIASLGPGYVERGVAILQGAGTTSYSFRTLATFTYSSSFSIFILVMVPIAWVSIGATRLRAWRAFSIATVLLLYASQISSGGRQALVFTASAMLVTEVYTKRRFLPRLAAPIVIAVGLLLGFFLFGQEKLDRYETILDVEQVKWRYETYFVANNLDAIAASPWGHGSGAASTAARHVGTIRFGRTETAVSKLAYEVGIPGLIAYFWMLGAVVRRSVRSLRGLASYRMLLFNRAFLAIALTTLVTSLNGWPLDLPPANALFWIFGGIALGAPYLESEAAPSLAETLSTAGLAQRPHPSTV